MIRILFSFFVIWFILAVSQIQASEILVKVHANDSQCLKCHPSSKTKDLRFQTGELIPTNQVNAKIPVLCGQCHGIVKRNWDHNLHGKKINSWKSAEAEQLVCTKCHAPNKPKFLQMKASPPPKIPQFAIPKGQENE